MKTQTKCDWCKTSRERKDLKAIVSKELHGKDVLFFCLATNCESFYNLRKEGYYVNGC